MIKKNLWPFVIFILVVLGVFYFNFIKPRDVKNEVIINGHSIFVEVMDTPDLRAKGLSGRERLNGNTGMLFIFEAPGDYGFWMKEMNFPIDIIWISDGKVVGFEKNVEPEPGVSTLNLRTYSSPQPVEVVLEVAAGTVDRLEIKNGDSVSIRL